MSLFTVHVSFPDSLHDDLHQLTHAVTKNTHNVTLLTSYVQALLFQVQKLQPRFIITGVTNVSRPTTLPKKEK